MTDLNVLAERNPATMIDPATQSETSMTDSRDLTSILVSRICHDLVSPVGAIVNGVDLVREIGGGDIEAELAMISQSSNRASALLQFYRIAFGAASDDSEISRSALHEHASAFLASPRILIDWDAAGGPHLGRPVAKLLLQVLLCARGLSGMRGVISVNLPESDSLPIDVVIDSEGGPEAPEMLALLKGDDNAANTSPRLVEFALARVTAQETGLDLRISQVPGQTTITIS